MIAALRAELVERRGSGWRWAAMLVGPTVAVVLLVSWVVMVGEEREWTWHPTGYTLDAESIMALLIPFGAGLSAVVAIQAARRPYKHQTMQPIAATGVRREWVLAAQAITAWLTAAVATTLAVLVGVLLGAWVNHPESFDDWRARIANTPDSGWVSSDNLRVDELWPGAVEHALARDIADDWADEHGVDAAAIYRPVADDQLPDAPMVAVFTSGNFTELSAREVQRRGSIGTIREPDLSPGALIVAIHDAATDTVGVLDAARTPVAMALDVPESAVGAVDVTLTEGTVSEVDLIADPGDAWHSRKQLIHFLDRIADTGGFDLDAALAAGDGERSGATSMVDIGALRSAIPPRILPEETLHAIYERSLDAGDGPTAYRNGQRHLLVDLATAIALYLVVVLFFHGLAAGLRRGVVAIGFILFAILVIQQFRWSFAARDLFVQDSTVSPHAPALSPDASAAVIIARAFELPVGHFSPFVMPTLVGSWIYIGSLTLAMVGLGVWRTLRTDL